jgi:hypothetical protein
MNNIKIGIILLIIGTLLVGSQISDSYGLTQEQIDNLNDGSFQYEYPYWAYDENGEIKENWQQYNPNNYNKSTNIVKSPNKYRVNSKYLVKNGKKYIKLEETC